MIGNRKINLIIGGVFAAAVLFILIFMFYPDLLGIKKSTEDPAYATKVFGPDIMNLDIVVDETTWQSMLDNARNETYIMCDVVINGETFSSIGIRPKGNSSLTQVVNSDSDRYSFKLDFSQYVTDQTCYGLNKFVVNNIQGDSTYMKEYLSYELMDFLGVPAPLHTYASITLNGEPWGLYLAVESLEESFAQRNFGSDYGQLYSVKKTMGAPGDKDIPQLDDNARNGGNPPDTNSPNQPDVNIPQNAATPANTINPPNMPDMQNVPNMMDTSNTDPANRPDTPNMVNPGADVQQNANEGQRAQAGMGGNFPGGRGGGGMNLNSGGSLIYTDDNSSSYSDIFANAAYQSNEKYYARVIKAIKALNEGVDIEQYFDVDEILRYFAAHNTTVNLDSYNSGMAQNYYIYEENGKLQILPWDYNLSFGGFQSGNAASAINFAIDTPVSGVSMSDRPLLDKLLSNSDYLTLYHEYLDDIVTDYFESGVCAATIDRIDNLISEYVQNDQTAFFTYDSYKTGVSTLKQFCDLRAQSIRGQLNGTIPSTNEGQTANQEALIDAGTLNLSDLGSMGGGGRGGGWGGEQGDNNQPPGGGMPNFNREVMQQAREIIGDSNIADLSEEQLARLNELGVTDEMLEMFKNVFPGGMAQQNGRDFGGQNPPGQPNTTDNSNTLRYSTFLDRNGLLASGVCFLAIIAGIGFMFLFKRKK